MNYGDFLLLPIEIFVSFFLLFFTTFLFLYSIVWFMLKHGNDDDFVFSHPKKNSPSKIIEFSYGSTHTSEPHRSQWISQIFLLPSSTSQRWDERQNGWRTFQDLCAFITTKSHTSPHTKGKMNEREHITFHHAVGGKSRAMRIILRALTTIDDGLRTNKNA